MIAKLAVLVAAAGAVVANVHGHGQAQGHRGVARRHEESERSHGVSSIGERGYSYNDIRATYYDTGLTACGGTYSNSDFIVALSQTTFGYTGDSPYCGKSIIISYGGKTATATIQDSCPGCGEHGPWCLDLTPGLFSYFADESLGVINVAWSFADGSSGGSGGGDTATTSTSKKVEAPKTTSTKVKPTTTWVPLTTSTKEEEEKTTTTHTTHHTTSTTEVPAPTTTSALNTTTSSAAPAVTTGVAGRCVSKDQRKRMMMERVAKHGRKH